MNGANDALLKEACNSSRRVKVLLETLQKKPKNARIMAELSSLLKGESEEEYNKENKEKQQCLLQEAEKWANKSIETAPHKPYGYTVLSTVSPNYETRRNALQQLLQAYTHQQPLEKQHEIPYAVALVRVLVEAREEEALRNTNKNISKANKSHPIRRDLSTNEQTMYDDTIVQALDTAYATLLRNKNDFNINNIKNHQRNAVMYLCKSEYRLGVFFRRMHRHHDDDAATKCNKDHDATHRPKSRRHFTRVLEIYHVVCATTANNENDKTKGSSHPNSGDVADVVIAKLAQKSQFWLATFQTDLIQDENHEGYNTSTSNDTSLLSSSSLTSIPQIDCCPEDYILSLYSSFAPKFDDLLVNKLQYQTPTLLRKLVNSTVSTTTASSMVWSNLCIDLGCGTGLSGLAFKSCTKYMVGTDLSPDMIDVARERRSDCYNDFDVVSVEDAFPMVMKKIQNQQHSPCSSSSYYGDTVSKIVDLVIACDVFVYLGNLQPIFESVHKYLTPDTGRFAFSTERLDTAKGEKDEEGRGYVLLPTARFAHKKSYIEKLARKIGFQVEAMKLCPIRKNGGKDINGILVVLSVPST